MRHTIRSCTCLFYGKRGLLLLAAATCSLKAGGQVLGSAANFEALGASTVTNTGPTVINGDLGVYAGTSITGFPPGIVHGTIHDADAVAMTAQTDALSAYNTLAGMPATHNLTGQNLGGQTLLPGVYKFNTSAQLTGQLALDFQGLSNQEYVFQIGSTLTTASASSVLLENGGANDQVYWDVGSSATLGTTTDFYGDVIAVASVTLTTGVTDPCGAVYALNGAVTLDTNTLGGGCSGVGLPPGVNTMPEPSVSVFVLCLSVAAGGEMLRRRRRTKHA